MLGLALALALAGVAFAWPRAEPPVAPGTSWASLLAPLAPGREVAAGFVLGPLARGHEQDLVLVARRPGSESVVEVHVVRRGQWEGSRETASFDVDYEQPRTTASADEAAAVTERVWKVVGAQDPGGLAAPDAIPLSPGTSVAPLPALLDLLGWRGWAAGAAIALATALLSTARRGAAWTSAWLFALGLLLRAPRLGFPFAIDQDVQRMFTGHLPLGQILTGQGLNDRHPPLYFAVLHVAQWAGQSEAAGRAPAVLAGALVGPALVAGAWVAARARGPHVATAALLATVSPELVLRSREVSDIPLFALLAIALCATYAAAIERPTRRRTAAVAASGGLALFTYYLAPLVLGGAVAAGWLGRRASRRATRGAVLGVLLGVPALALELRIFLRDEGARAAARAHPEFAWGQHGVSDMAAQLWGAATQAFGSPVLVMAAVVVVAAAVRRHVPSLVPSGALLATFAGIALVAPLARVQAYYLVAVLPLALLALAVGVPRGTGASCLAAAVLGVLCVSFSVPRLRSAQWIYGPSPDAFMAGFARAIDGRPERRVALTADYDATLLAYELARLHDVPMDWSGMSGDGDVVRLRGLPQVLEPLLRVHSPGPDPDGRALRLLREALVDAPVLVVVREGFGLPQLYAELARCDVVAESPRARLVACSRPGP